MYVVHVVHVRREAARSKLARLLATYVHQFPFARTRGNVLISTPRENAGAGATIVAIRASAAKLADWAWPMPKIKTGWPWGHPVALFSAFSFDFAACD